MAEHSNSFFIPEKSYLPLRTAEVRQLYHNLIPEIGMANYPSDKISLLKDKHNYYGKYLSEDTREFFLNHFGRNLAEAVNFFFDGRNNVKYLEVGSGCGNQLLLMSFLGAEAIGCDIRGEVCDLVERRKRFYERISGRKLDISLLCENVFEVHWHSCGTFDAIYFLFSFNNLQPNEGILELVNRLLKPGGRIVLQETNPSNYYNRIFRNRDSMTPMKIAETLKNNNFKVCSLRGGYAIPPVFWRILPGKILSPVDQLLCRSLFLSVSYHLMAEKMY